MKIKSIITYVAWIFVLLLVPIVSADLNYTTLNSVFSNFSVCYNSEGVYNNGSTIIGNINGTIDDVMIFNTSLNSTQILDIYNNQSARYFGTGTQDIHNQSYMNISSGNNKVNVSTTIENNMGSQINLSVGYYDGSWAYTAPQTITNGVNNSFDISSTSTNLTLNYTFIAGNDSTSFYSPLIFGDITFEAWSSGAPPEDTCTCAGLDTNWEVDLSDYCVITDNCDLGTGKLNFTGIGNFTCNARIDTTDLGDPGTDNYLYINDECNIYII